MNVYDQAHGLAQAIKGSEEFKRYDALKKQIDANESLAAMVKDFQQKNLEVQTKQMMGEQMTPEDIGQIQQLYAIMVRDPLAAQYMEAEMRFSIMMKDVYEILGEAIGAGGLFG
ncbi:MAG: YlbF family regulator [Firmicutes bacterium]|nr:YlbF family regulator [Bacillota bacterium]